MDDPSVVMKHFVLAIQSGQWGVAVSMGLMLVVFALRLVVRRLPTSGLTVALTGPWGGWVLNFTASIAGAVGTALLTGQAVTAVLLVSALTNALAASGAWELLKDAAARPTLSAAALAGESAGSAVVTKDDAAKAL